MKPLNKSCRFVVFIPYLILFVFCVSLFLPGVSSGGWFKSHDGMRYMFSFLEFKETFENGQFYPRWHANMYGGFGYPTFTFYQPGFFYLLLAVSLLIKNILHIFYASLILLFFFSGIGAYKLARNFSDRITSLFIALFYLLTPYIYVNLYVRGDLSELAAMLLGPWPVYFLLKLQDERDFSRLIVNLTLLALALAWIIISHPATAFFYFPSFSMLLLAAGLKKEGFDFRLFRSLALALALSVILTSPYWLTLFMMKKYANFEAIASYYTRPWDHVVYWKQFFINFWGFEYSNPGSADGMPFQLGLIHFLLSCLGAWVGRKNKVIICSFLIYVGLIILMSPWGTLAWQRIKFLQYIQFPWRILSVTSTLQLIVLCGIGKYFLSKANWIKLGALSLVLAVTIFVHHKQLVPTAVQADIDGQMKAYMAMRLFKFTGLNAENEFLPKFVDFSQLTYARGSREMILSSSPILLEALPGNSPYHIKYNFSSKEKVGLLINQFYFPGWKIILNNEPLSAKLIEEYLAPNGLMRVVAPSGEDQTIEAYYNGPPYKEVRTAVVIILSVLLFFLLIKFNWNLRVK